MLQFCGLVLIYVFRAVSGGLPKLFNFALLFIWGKVVGVKTYLTIWFYSEGASPMEVVEKLRSMGFEPLRGYHDHVYNWGRKVDLIEVLQLANKVHETLRGMKVFYKLETSE